MNVVEVEFTFDAVVVGVAFVVGGDDFRFARNWDRYSWPRRWIEGIL
jgi:hypothetical protein